MKQQKELNFCGPEKGRFGGHEKAGYCALTAANAVSNG